MSRTIVIDLPERVEAALDKLTQEKGLSQNEVVTTALDDYFFIHKFRNVRQKMISGAQRKYTDEDIFKSVS